MIPYGQVRPFWERTYGSRYRIDEAIWNARAHGEWITVPGAFALLREERIAAFAFADATAGREALRRLPPGPWTFGQDARHFWPGVPEEAREVRDLLEEAGFAPGEGVVDLERDLVGYARRHPDSNRPDLRPATAGDLPALERFFRREFPGRWCTDTLAQIGSAGPETAFLWRPDGVEGFALLQTDRQPDPIGGGVWRNDLAPHWGALGPIGIAAARRGEGMGGRLLDAALAELARRGVRQTIIDWTTLTDYYGKYGFVPTRRYVGYSRPG